MRGRQYRSAGRSAPSAETAGDPHSCTESRAEAAARTREQKRGYADKFTTETIRKTQQVDKAIQSLHRKLKSTDRVARRGQSVLRGLGRSSRRLRRQKGVDCILRPVVSPAIRILREGPARHIFRCSAELPCARDGSSIACEA